VTWAPALRRNLPFRVRGKRADRCQTIKKRGNHRESGPRCLREGSEKTRVEHMEELGCHWKPRQIPYSGMARCLRRGSGKESTEGKKIQRRGNQANFPRESHKSATDQEESAREKPYFKGRQKRAKTIGVTTIVIFHTIERARMQLKKFRG